MLCFGPGGFFLSAYRHVPAVLTNRVQPAIHTRTIARGTAHAVACEV